MPQKRSTIDDRGGLGWPVSKRRLMVLDDSDALSQIDVPLGKGYKDLVRETHSFPH